MKPIGRARRRNIEMVILRIPDENVLIEEHDKIQDYLANIGIEHERWKPTVNVAPDASPEQIITVYEKQINELKKRGGYTTADVIDVNQDTPGLDAMLAKFNIEHSHSEDEVRFIVSGRGLFHIHPEQGPVVTIEVEQGDLIRVPRGTLHWFDLCGDRHICAIRLFQNSSGWTPIYTNSKIDKRYEPVCLGPTYLPPKARTK
jgi:1,2-dihydroxy-3-keto-5-methylthiopentene dioxygenase